MASLPRRPRRPPFELLCEVSEAYGHLTPPEEDDGAEYGRIYGRALLETKQNVDTINQRLVNLENSGIVIPSPKGSYHDGCFSQSSQLDDIQGHVHEITERLDEMDEHVKRRLTDVEDEVAAVKGDMEDKVGNTTADMEDLDTDLSDKIEILGNKVEELTDKTEAVETKVGELSNKVEQLTDRMEAVENKIEQLTDRMEAVETKVDQLTDRTEAVENKVDKLIDRMDTLEDKMNMLIGQFATFNDRLDRSDAIVRNSRISRLNQAVISVPAYYRDEEGNISFRSYLGPKRNVWWYWKLHQPKNMELLIAEHEFYRIDYDSWLDMHENSHSADGDDEEDDDLSGMPTRPITLREAIERYQDQAVLALFDEIGLNHGQIMDVLERWNTRERPAVQQIEKRLYAGIPPLPEAKRRNLAHVSPDVMSRSSTQSHE